MLIFNRILALLEPKDVIEQSYLPVEKRSIRMLLADAFYLTFRRFID